MPTPINAVCNREYLREPLDGHRNPEEIRYIVLHDTEGGTARAIAHYFHTSTAGYTHLVVDDSECYRCLTNDDIPRGAPGANEHGFHIEQCGFAKWSFVIWKSHYKTLQRAAYKTALHCHKFNIPPVFLTADLLKKGLKGVTTHAECSKAFGGDHTDPGRGWPRLLFMGLVRKYYKELENNL